MPMTQLPAGFTDNPVANRYDQAIILRHGNESVRCNQFTGFRHHAQQRFHANDLFIVRPILWLVVKLQPLLSQLPF